MSTASTLSNTESSPFGLTIHGCSDGKRQLRNIDRSMKSITKLLKSPTKTPSSTKTTVATVTKPTKVKKRTRSRKPKVLVILNDQNTKCEVPEQLRKDTLFDKKNNLTKNYEQKSKSLTAQEIKKAEMFDAETYFKTNQELTVSRASNIKVEKPINSHKNNERDIEPNCSNVVLNTKSIKKKCVKKNKEFYPNKLKRKLIQRHNWLKPKMELKPVCRLEGVVRRKLYVPKQDSKVYNSCIPKKNLQPNYSELSMKGMVRVLEDRGLSDDDFMEILTCPSPVWWEDQNDSSDEFIEDAIPGEILDDVDEKLIVNIISNVGIKENEPIGSLKDIKISTNDEKFIKKRNKLENLLGSIIKHVKSNTVKAKANLKTGKTIVQKDTETDNLKESNEKETAINENNESKQDDNNSNDPVSRISISSDENMSVEGLCDEDVLRDLEDMEIPIEKTNKCEKITDSEMTEVYIICDDKEEARNQTSTKKSLKTVGKQTSNNKSLLKRLTEDKNTTDNTESKNVGCLSVIGSEKCNDDKDASVNNLNSKTNLDTNNTKTKHGRINVFHKKCKNIRRSKSTSKGSPKTDRSVLKPSQNSTPCRSCNPEDSKSLNVTNDQSEKVKYCLHCSAIFDTDECKFCSNSSKNGNVVPQCCTVREVTKDWEVSDQEEENVVVS